MNGEVKIQRVPMWLCHGGTGHMHRSRYIRRQTSENVYHPISHYLCEEHEGHFLCGSPHFLILHVLYHDAGTIIVLGNAINAHSCCICIQI